MPVGMLLRQVVGGPVLLVALVLDIPASWALPPTVPALIEVGNAVPHVLIPAIRGLPSVDLFVGLRRALGR